MMMNRQSLPDDAARAAALAQHDRSLLVEAGAGSGKTAVLAGRVALLLAEGVAPGSVAAVTFTELAAGELMARVRSFATAMHAGSVPPELQIALPGGVTPVQRDNLGKALEQLDELACSTIHGFCQRLVTPYPAEANIDPGASVIDAQSADRLFNDMLDRWLWQALDQASGSMLAELVGMDVDGTVRLVRDVAGQLRRQRTATVAPAGNLAEAVDALAAAAERYARCLDGTRVDDPATREAVDAFRTMASAATAGIGAAQIVMLAAETVLCKSDGDFRIWRNSGKWTASAKVSGIGKADAKVFYEELAAHHETCCEAWRQLKATSANVVLANVAQLLQPLLADFAQAKRNAAMLDFDDLIYAARDLLRDHEPVRQALAARYRHVLVDEFQDTDSLQSEIFWRLCGERNMDSDTDEWHRRCIRPGALFLVGDPKQAIYRFRGADIAAYTAARDAFREHDPDSVLAISTNFRSLSPVLDYVNTHFQPVLDAPGQPGFTALQAFRSARAGNVGVAALDIAIAADAEAGSAEVLRDAEADAVGALVADMVGRLQVADRNTGGLRPCRAGDVALLAPGGTDLWRYEMALEQRGIPVVSQAGKGFYRRQEVQDMVALTRVLADVRDTIALGALLRGPLVGLTEEELVDIVWELPRGESGSLPRLTVLQDIESVAHPLARHVLATLQALCAKAETTTPALLLAEAVSILRVRPLLRQRHRHDPIRALANIDRFVDLARPYAVSGLAAFAAAVSGAWTEEASEVEGRADVHADAVTLYTMHAAKGLEWPVVIPVNTMTRVRSAESTFVARDSGSLYCPVFGVRIPGHDMAQDEEQSQLGHERMRLWYVAATRARELFVLPRFADGPQANQWAGLLDLGHARLPAVDIPDVEIATDPIAAALAVPGSSGVQTATAFAAERQLIEENRQYIEWRKPSRGEGTGVVPGPDDLSADASTALNVPDLREHGTTVKGSAARGTVLHKLMEEVLTGETEDTADALSQRAALLVADLGLDGMQGLEPAALAAVVRSTLALPEVAAVRSRLVPEYPLWSSAPENGLEVVQAGIADAVAFDVDGKPELVIDWKSDVAPTAGALLHYRAQVGSYLRIAQVPHGLIVFMTTGTVIAVAAEEAVRQ